MRMGLSSAAAPLAVSIEPGAEDDGAGEVRSVDGIPCEMSEGELQMRKLICL